MRKREAATLMNVLAVVAASAERDQLTEAMTVVRLPDAETCGLTIRWRIGTRGVSVHHCVSEEANNGNRQPIVQCRELVVDGMTVTRDAHGPLLAVLPETLDWLLQGEAVSNSEAKEDA